MKEEWGKDWVEQGRGNNESRRRDGEKKKGSASNVTAVIVSMGSGVIFANPRASGSWTSHIICCHQPTNCCYATRSLAACLCRPMYFCISVGVKRRVSSWPVSRPWRLFVALAPHCWVANWHYSLPNKKEGSGDGSTAVVVARECPWVQFM